MAYSEAKLCKKQYFTLLPEIITKMFYWSIGALTYILEYPPKIADDRYILIIFVKKLNFVKLWCSRFLKNIWALSMNCEHSRWIAWNYSVYYQRGSRATAAFKTKLPVSIVCNFQPLTVVSKNLDVAAPKLYFTLICFCFKWFHQNIIFMYFSPIHKILSNW